MSGFDTGWADTTVLVASPDGPPPRSVTTLAIEIARLQAPVGTWNRFVTIVVLEDETTAGLGAVVLESVAMVHDRIAGNWTESQTVTMPRWYNTAKCLRRIFSVIVSVLRGNPPKGKHYLSMIHRRGRSLSPP